MISPFRHCECCGAPNLEPESCLHCKNIRDIHDEMSRWAWKVEPLLGSTMQVDQGLQNYYYHKGVLYLNDEGIGRFAEWTVENGYDTETIQEDLSMDDVSETSIIEFDDGFPTKKQGVERDQEIYEVLYSCWAVPSAFKHSAEIPQYQSLNSGLEKIDYKQKILFHGFVRLEILTHFKLERIPLDIIQLCSTFHGINLTHLTTRSEIINLAKVFFTNFEYFMAIQLYKLSSNLKDGARQHSLSKLMIAIIYTRCKDFEQADIAYHRAIKIAPDEPQFYYYYYYEYAFMFSQQGDDSRSLANLTKAYEICCTDGYSTGPKAKIAFECSILCMKIRDYSGAKRYLLDAIAFDDNNRSYKSLYHELLSEYRWYTELKCKLCNDSICRECGESCDECKQFFYYKRVYKCKGCDSNICAECKDFYGWRGGKTLNKCSICHNIKRGTWRLMYPAIDEQYPGNFKEYPWVDVESKYDKRRKYKAKNHRRSQMIRTYSHHRKIDRVSNIKQRTKFNRRYALSLQY